MAANGDAAPASSTGHHGATPSRALSIEGGGGGESAPLLRVSGDPIKPSKDAYGSGGADDEETGKESSRCPPPGTVDVVPTWRGVLRLVLPYLRPDGARHSALAAAALTAVVAGKIVNVLPPLAIRAAVDVIGAGAGRVPAKEIGAYFALKLLSMILASVQDLCQRTVSLDAERRFANAAFAHLHSLSLSYHLEKHIGEITRIMNRGVDSVSTVINSFLFSLAPTLFETCIVTAIFWKLGTPGIAITTLSVVALYFAFTIVVTKTRVTYRRRLIEANDAVGQKETETLVNYETVAMFGRTRHEVEDYGELRQEYKDRRVEMLSMFNVLEFGQKFIRLAGVSAGLFMAGYATVHGDPPLSAGSFVAVQLYIDQLFQPLMWLGMTYRMLTQAFTDLEKTVTMLQRVPEVKDAPDAVTWSPPTVGEAGMRPSGEIAFRDVTFHYKATSRRRALGGKLDVPSRKAGGGGRFGMWDNPTESKKKGKKGKGGKSVDDEEEEEEEEEPLPSVGGGVDSLSFSVPAGKTAALVGKSGSGKTTIVRLVLRLYDVDSGSVTIDGLDARSLTQESLRRNIGVVAQETVLWNASVRDNVKYGRPVASDDEVWAALKTAALDDFVRKLPDGLDTLVGERGMKLSGGERQRVGLARCVLKDPRLILLDEATSALDTETERKIRENVREVCRGRTTLMIAHRLSTARHADEIIVLDGGTIAERGTHDELIERGGRYAKMWQDQTATEDDE
eukprot:CAMPEP_0113528560 /NCGR_PEP_ID=MMETSP0015_2-20120614/1912_1 /TAXON_ID=2838 /ORGANISM="Odontella" /LENGTH=734 /DNA_ID=CAMNT_0000427105 /DNA_START=209 /DNA_END=2413 /DNA_ORIENTATION=+ /assembly_acc=CAM_ASM_000160